MQKLAAAKNIEDKETTIIFNPHMSDCWKNVMIKKHGKFIVRQNTYTVINSKTIF